MKTVSFIFFLLSLAVCLAQPTGHQRLFLQVLDKGDTLHFEKKFRTPFQSFEKLKYKEYELRDVSKNPTGFEYYANNKFIHKTLMTDNHRIQIVKNKRDTMNIELLNTFNVYFLCISFQKGNFRLYVNDGIEHKWNHNTLPYKIIENEQQVFDITPPDWDLFKVSWIKTKSDYFISKKYEKLNILAKLVLPEEDPNFRNPRRISTLRLESEDYNFDGQKDYREQKMQDLSRWNYFLYTNPDTGFVLDTLLSNLDDCSFDFQKKTFVGSKTIRINSSLTQQNSYAFVEGKTTLVRRMECPHAFFNTKNVDCTVYELENGQLVLKEQIKKEDK